MHKRKNLAINIVNPHSRQSDLAYWLSKSLKERISAMEFLREQAYALEGYTSVPRLAHTLTIRKRHTTHVKNTP